VSHPSAKLFVGLAASVALISFPGCRSHHFPQHPSNYREFAYVSNGGSNTVSVYDVVNMRLDRELQVGQSPSGVTANPKRNEVYVVNSGGSQGSISVIDTEKNAVVATIPVHKQPYFLDVDKDGERAYVANSGSNSVSVLDLGTRREIAEIHTGLGPGLARISPDGKSLVVTNRLGNSVTVIDAKSGQVRKTIDGCPGATDVVVMTDSTKAFAACSAGHQIMAITLGNSEGKQVAVEALLAVGRSPISLALKPDGGELFVTNYDSDSISEVVTGTNDVGGAYMVGSRPVRGLVSPDNSLLYVSNFRSQELTVYSIDDGKRTGSIHVGDGPDALAFSSDGYLLFVVDARSSDLAVIRTNTGTPNIGTLFTLLPTGRQPNAIAVKAFQQK